MEPDSSIPVELDSSILVELDSSIPAEPDSSLPVEIDTSIPVEPDSSILVELDSGIPVELFHCSRECVDGAIMEYFPFRLYTIGMLPVPSIHIPLADGTERDTSLQIIDLTGNN